VALALENIAAGNVTPSAFAVTCVQVISTFSPESEHQELLPCRVGRGWIKRVVWDMSTGATDQ
jgi:NADH:ubiquinone oxidoreductase subunit F (NADH-binding)